jgi:hypothetical protein
MVKKYLFLGGNSDSDWRWEIQPVFVVAPASRREPPSLGGVAQPNGDVVSVIDRSSHSIGVRRVDQL